MCHLACRFDGDGMLHAVRIKAGKASYSNAYLQTSLLKQEKKAGRSLKLKACLLITDELFPSMLTMLKFLSPLCAYMRCCVGKAQCSPFSNMTLWSDTEELDSKDEACLRLHWQWQQHMS